LKYLRADPGSNLDWRQHNDAFLDARCDKIALAQVCCGENVLVKRHSKAVSLLSNLHGIHV